MATVERTITKDDGIVLLVDAADDFNIQVISSGTLRYGYADSLPDNESGFRRLKSDQADIRLNDGALYGSTPTRVTLSITTNALAE